MKLGFCNGVFDGLHAGHKHLFAHALTHCHKLIVAINTDEDVRMLKGEGRPFHRLRDRRAALLDLLGFDHEIYSFRHVNLEAMIRAFRPDFIFKGGDYKPEDVRGADIVKEWGGKVVIIPILAGHGTSRPKQGTQPETCRP